MDRRTLLVGLAAGVSGLAGCAGALGGTDRNGGRATAPTPTPTSSRLDGPGTIGRSATPLRSDSVAEHGTPTTICSTRIDADFGIRAIVGPAFAADWDGIDVDERYRFRTPGSVLGDDSTVVGLTDGERARAYPLSVVWWHEVVNDAFGSSAGPDTEFDDTSERPVIVTYCPICQSGMVADRLVGGDPTTFGVSGQLWQPPALQTQAAIFGNRSFGATVREPNAEARNSGNLVLYDEATRSYWSQLLAKAICGPRAGDELTIRPSTVTSWGEWRAEHPTTEVLLPPPHSALM